jgi:hypothetical protein
VGWKGALIGAPLAGTLGTGGLALVGPRAGLAPLTVVELWLLVTFTLGVLALLFGLSLAVGGRLLGLAGRVRRGEVPESVIGEPDPRKEEEWRALLRFAAVLLLLYTSTWIVAG